MVVPNGVIAVLTDFGNKDNYVGVMKGVISSINEKAKIIDLTNEIPPHSIRAGAFQLYTSYRYFPRGTTFLCVVDPGVGTERKPIAIQTKSYFFVGPDNGLMYPSVVEDGIEKIVVLENEDFFLREVSTTFHGRDIFAPVSAWISKGINLEMLGESINVDALVKIELTKYIQEENGLVGIINYVDRFGNVITSIPNSFYLQLPKEVFIIANDKRLRARKALTYGEGGKDELLVIKGSHGFIEIAMNQINASERLGLRENDKIVIKFDYH